MDDRSRNIYFGPWEFGNYNLETQKLFNYVYLVALQHLQIERVVNRVRFVEEMSYEWMNVFIYYKTLTIHLDNIVAIILKNYQFALSRPWQVFAVAYISKRRDLGAWHQGRDIHKYQGVNRRGEGLSDFFSGYLPLPLSLPLAQVVRQAWSRADTGINRSYTSV